MEIYTVYLRKQSFLYIFEGADLAAFKAPKRRIRKLQKAEFDNLI